MPKQTKQQQIDELERTLKIEQEGLRAEKANLARLVDKQEKDRVLAKMNHYAETAQFAGRLLSIIEALACRKAS